MPDDVVLHDIAGEVANNLMDLHGHASVTRGTEAHGLDGRIDHAPLPSPVVADAAVPAHGAALHANGPGDIRVYRGQNGLDVPRIEGRIGPRKKMLGIASVGRMRRVSASRRVAQTRSYSIVSSVSARSPTSPGNSGDTSSIRTVSRRGR